ncbi:MAG TPA: PhnD/SsuA/transferrin family substrate-binding protein, partial [Pirellulales bacterium]
MSTAPSAPSGNPSFSLVRVLIILVPALVVVGAVYAMKSHELSEEARDKEAKLQAAAGIKLGAAPMKLDDKFTDVDGNLVADPPADPAKQVSPDKLIFAFIAAPDSDTDKPNWQEFVKYLSEQIGKPVEMVTFKTTDEELAALKEGKLHVCGFNTGAVPLAVNTAGFVPICTRAGDDGQFSDSMEIIVPADSKIREKHPEDLKGQNITFAERTSNSGYKAAVIYLRDNGLEYPRDYNGSFSSSHQESIKGIADGVYAV